MSRLPVALLRDIKLQQRYRLYAVSVFMVLVWGGLLSLLPGTARANAAVVVPAFLVANLIVTTFYFMGGLVLLEKSEGMLAVLVTTPQRDTEYLTSKVITLSLLALLESLLIVVALFGTGFRWLPLLAGTLLLGAFYVLVGFIAIVRYHSINEWLMPSVAFVIFLMLPLLSHFALIDHLFFYLHPVEPALVLMRAAYRPVAEGELAYGALSALLWVGIGFVWARHRFHRFVVRTAGS